MRSLLIICLFFFLLSNSYSQTTTGTNGFITGNPFLGWNSSASHDVDIVNENSANINFHTDGGSGAPWNNLRMRIASNGNIGAGNITAPQSLFHMHSGSANNFFQMTNATTGNGSNAVGFTIDVNNTTPVATLTQNENQPMRFRIFDQNLGQMVQRAEWTTGQQMQDNYGNPATDGLRIWNPDYANSNNLSADQAIDIFCGEGGTTHMRFDGSGSIRGVNNRFELAARVTGFWFNAHPLDWQTGLRSNYIFNIDSLEIVRFCNGSNANRGFVRIGLIPGGGATDADTRLEVYDNANAPQFRITQSDNSVVCDFQTTSNGDMLINPSNSGNLRRVGINIGTGGTPSATLDVRGIAAGTLPQLRLTHLPPGGGSAGAGTWTDFHTTSAGNLVIRPTVNNSGSSVERNVGINVNAPAAKLHIQGDNAIPNFRITSSTSSDLMNVDDNSAFTFRSTVSSGSNGAYYFRTAPSTGTASGLYSEVITTSSNGGNNNAGYFFADDAANTSSSGVTTITGVSGRARSANTNGTWASNIWGVAGLAEALESNQVVYGGSFTGGGSGYIHYGVSGYASGGSSQDIGVAGACVSSATQAWGVKAQSTGTPVVGFGVEGYSDFGATNAFGVYGISGGADATEYGVYGYASGSATTGYGVYADAASPDCDDDNPSFNCYRAALFANGPAYSTVDFYTSDAQLKQNISNINNASELLSQLQPKTYDFKKSDYPTLNLPSGQQFGFIAQDIEQILPTLVKEFNNPGKFDTTGQKITDDVQFKALNYTAIIPILTAALQEQKARIDSLVNALNGSPKELNQNDDQLQDLLSQNRGQKVELRDVASVILNQNDPNPFTESTRITYLIPENVINAKIVFTNSTGMVINTVQINERGFSELQVFSSELNYGIYTYTLVCDGKIIDSKKMVKQ